MCSADNEPTELLFGHDLTKHVKDLTMTNKLKRSESYYQSKYSNNKYSEDNAKSYSRQYCFSSREGEPPAKDLEDQSSKSQEILITALELSLKHTPQNFHERQIAEHIQVW